MSQILQVQGLGSLLCCERVPLHGVIQSEFAGLLQQNALLIAHHSRQLLHVNRLLFCAWLDLVLASVVTRKVDLVLVERSSHILLQIAITVVMLFIVDCRRVEAG